MNLMTGEVTGRLSCDIMIIHKEVKKETYVWMKDQ